MLLRRFLIFEQVAVRGMITRTSGVIPDIKMGFFRCTACGNTVEVMIDRGKIQEPSSCTACQAKASMELVHNRCWFAGKYFKRRSGTRMEHCSYRHSVLFDLISL